MMKTYSTRSRLYAVILITSLVIGGAMIFTTGALVRAAPEAQVPIYTPTPGPDGRIIWVVKENDTLLSISLITGVPVDKLKELNKMTDDVIRVGQQLVIGLSGPALITPTAGPSPTPTPLLPTPTPKPGVGEICVILFDDSNGDAIREETEASIPGGAISVNNRSGSVSLTVDTTAGTEHYCFKDIAEGDYTISAAAPEGYNATTIGSSSIQLRAGDQTYIDFGAQANSQTLSEQQVIPSAGQRSPLLGIIGLIFLLVGGGLAVFASRLLKSR
jgi:hypothetical protein